LESQYIDLMKFLYAFLSALVVLSVLILGVWPKSRFRPPPPVKPSKEDKESKVSQKSKTTDKKGGGDVPTN